MSAQKRQGATRRKAQRDRETERETERERERERDRERERERERAKVPWKREKAAVSKIAFSFWVFQ